MGILNTLQYFAEILGAIWGVITHIWELFTRLVPSIIAGIGAVVGRYDAAIPLPLKVVAILCVSAMILRFTWNAVRGSGA